LLTQKAWPDYVSEYGSTSQDVPELLTLLGPESSAEMTDSWVQVHAWRALAQLRETRVLAPMLDLIDADENARALSEFDEVVSRIGAATTPVLTAVVADKKRSDSVRMAAVDALAALGMSDNEQLRTVTDRFSQQLSTPRQNSLQLNAAMVKACIRLHDVDAVPLIARAFEEQQVDLEMITWDEVVDALG
jgi:HEAT repeat protein